MKDLPVDKIKTYLEKNTKAVFKNVFLCWRITPLFIILGLFVFYSASCIESLSFRDFSFLTAKASSNNLFAKPVNSFLIDSSEMNLVQGNAMIGVIPPAAAGSQVLGAMTGVEPVGLASNNSISEYTVEENDTVSSVAEKFGISSNTILWANDLSSRSTIKLGQKLVILPVSGTIHLVKNGDTSSGLAKIYKADLEEIISFNNLSDEGDIYIGDSLIVPGGKMPAVLPQVNAVPLADSYFIFPTEGKISQGLHGPFSNAIDISNKCGKIVVASAGGTVQRAGSIKIGGNRVTVLHPNGVVTYYGHLSDIAVIPGQTVKAGQVIGYIGNTGYTFGATGCHLHFEVTGARNFLASYRLGSNISW